MLSFPRRRVRFRRPRARHRDGHPRDCTTPSLTAVAFGAPRGDTHRSPFRSAGRSGPARIELGETVALTAFARCDSLARIPAAGRHTALGTRRCRSGFVSAGRSGPARIRIAVTATRRPKDTKLPHRPAHSPRLFDPLTVAKTPTAWDGHPLTGASRPHPGTVSTSCSRRYPASCARPRWRGRRGPRRARARVVSGLGRPEAPPPLP